MVGGKDDLYVRDAQGNILSVISLPYEGAETVLVEKIDHHIYGSDRLGTDKRELGTVADYSPYIGEHRRQKNYALKNHLGNVLTTVSDQKLFDPNGAADNSQGHYVAQAVTISDYYPFGHQIADRSMSTNFGGAKHRYGFNDKEQDSDGEWGSSTTAYDYGFRIYNPGIARFLSVDPLRKSYPELTPYQFASNSPIANIDLDGLEQFYAANGTYLGKYGESTQLRVIGDYKLAYSANQMLNSEAMTPEYVHDVLIENSVEAYPKSQEKSVLKEWAKAYMPLSMEKEHAMALFSNTLLTGDGETIDVFIPGNTVEGEITSSGGLVDPYKSKLNLGNGPISVDNNYNKNKSGWRRSTTIHTHPKGASKEFSFEYGMGKTVGDIPYSLKENVPIIMVQPGNENIIIFDPLRFKNEFKGDEMPTGLQMKEYDKAVDTKKLESYDNE